MDEAELQWGQDPEFGAEAAFTNVGGSLLRGSPVAGSALDQPEAFSRNLFTEAEHQTHMRGARDILRGAAREDTGAGSDAEQIAAGGNRLGSAYIRDNAEQLTGQITQRQARAAQQLLDSYGKLAALRPSTRELGELIPSRDLEQAQWITRTKRELGGLLSGGAPEDVSSKLAELADGDDPVAWFSRASELGDSLLRARTRAAKDGASPEQLQAFDGARHELVEGLSDGGLWGAAAKLEGQRSQSYARRFGDHLSRFEDAFGAEAADGSRVTDPQRFRALLDGDPAAVEAMRETLESARVTADVADQFGRRDEARAIRKAADSLTRAQRQGDAIRSARGSDQQLDPAQAALELLSAPGAGGGGPTALGAMRLGGQAGQLHRAAYLGEENGAADAAPSLLAARGGAFRAAAAMAGGAEDALRRGVSALLRPVSDETDADPDDEGELAAPPERPPAVDAASLEGVRTHLDRMTKDPSYFGSVLASSFGQMPTAAPEVFGALATQTAKAAQYLSAVAPGRPRADGGPFARPVTAGDDELWEFNERLSAITDPEFMRTELEAGRLSKPAVEAFAVMNPKGMFRLQMAIAERLGELANQGATLPANASAQLETISGIDGGGEYGLTWSAAQRAHDAQQQRQKQAAQGAPTGQDPRAGAMSSGALSTLNNGASAIAQTG